MRFLPLLFDAAFACAFQAPALSIDCHFERASSVPFKLVWQSQADRNYDLFFSPDLAGWIPVEGWVGWEDPDLHQSVIELRIRVEDVAIMAATYGTGP